VRDNSLEPTFQLYNHRWRAILRNYAYRRMIPSATLLLAVGGEDRFRRLFETAVRHRSYVHVWGHASDVERLNLWGELRWLLATAAELRLIPVSNSEAFDRLSRGTGNET
jgi:hypothetical protein